ncbi:hypothetical protein NUW58_g2278 [Xylaria curta]|uniref:Uncharacterized protein n=1 Tax=Xylaria curta TaxID=42375 RepID=A0ACC1PGI7_9PEZI|nr:hypothetical protein NUW58_g2278 [Xylaria curta]
MVGFVERFKRPKLPVVLGSPQKDGIVLEQSAPKSQNIKPPVLRNFSYPTNVTNSNPPPPTPPSPSTWDQLGKICNFSPDSDSQARRDKASGLEDPFFYTTDRTSYKQLPNHYEELNVNSVEKNTPDLETLTVERALEKIQRRSTFITARLKRSSLGHHKTSSSFDASRLLIRRSSSLERPLSSSGVPLIDAKLANSPSTAVKTGNIPLFLPEDAVEGISAGLETIAHTSRAQLDPDATGMARLNLKGDPQELCRPSTSSEGLAKTQPHVLEPGNRKGKGGKSRWLSQLKDWVSISEPSAQALKKYKKDTFQKAGIALDDPLANAKLHLPVALMPSDAIRPGGRGPEPEEIALRRAMLRKKTSEMPSSTGASQGHFSSGSHYPSSRTATVNAAKNGD